MPVVKDFKKNDKWVRTYSDIVTCKRVIYKTKSYQTWCAMIERCTEGSDAQRRSPSYKGCTVSDEFKDFQIFAEWHTSQIGYGLNYQIDKDLLLEGNRVYSRDTCVLLPQLLNSFIISSRKARGVHWAVNENKYVAQVSDNGRSTHLGYFDDIESAITVHKLSKIKLARAWANKLISENFVIDPRVVTRLENFE